MLLLFGGLEQWQDLYVKKMSPVYGSQGFCPELAKKKAYNEFWRMVAEENWLEIPADEAILVDPDNLEVKKTAAEWLEERGSIYGLILASFADTLAESTSTFDELTIEIKEE